MPDISKIDIERINDLENTLNALETDITTTVETSISSMQTQLNNKIQLVTALPANPVEGVLYCIPE